MDSKELMDETLKQIKKIRNLKITEKKTENFKKGKFYIVADTGKCRTNAFLISAFRKNASKKTKCGFISTIKNEAQVGIELLSNISGITSHEIIDECNAENLQRIETAAAEILNLPLEIVEAPGYSHLDISNEICRLKNEEACEIVFAEALDHLHYHNSDSNLYDLVDVKEINPVETEHIYDSFRQLAKELDIPIVASLSLSFVKKQRLPIMYAARKNCDVFMLFEKDPDATSGDFYNCWLHILENGSEPPYSIPLKVSYYPPLVYAQ